MLCFLLRQSQFECRVTFRVHVYIPRREASLGQPTLGELSRQFPADLDSVCGISVCCLLCKLRIVHKPHQSLAGARLQIDSVSVP